MAEPAAPGPAAVNVTARRAEAAVISVTQPCDYCTLPIVWACTVNDRRMPLDAGPVPTGNVLLLVDGPLLRATIVASPRARDILRREGHPLRVTHRLSCPYVDQWARPGGPARGAQNQPRRTPTAPARRGAGRAARRPRA